MTTRACCCDNKSMFVTCMFMHLYIWQSQTYIQVHVYMLSLTEKEANISIWPTLVFTCLTLSLPPSTPQPPPPPVCFLETGFPVKGDT